MTDSASQESSRTGAEGLSGSPEQARLLERLRLATVGEYDVYGEIGRGGMATVYVAHEVSLDRKVAIKVMSPAMVYGAGLVERFKREARTAAHLSHPNIIPIYAVREAEGLLYFVMKLVEGTPLDSIMRELGKLPLPMVEAILAQVGGAFGYAHRRGVIHRDIKPGNILIDEEGWAVVTDFGIAKVQDSEDLTQSGVAVGTPTYMSPEQCSGGTITGASDQYSLGVVAYEMLAGRPPFSGPSMMSLLYGHFHEPAPPLELFRPDCPLPMRTAVMRMLEKDPAARWPSIEEAIAAMGARQFAHDDPTRDQLITLARSGTSHKVVSQVQTPRSPIPIPRKTGATAVQVESGPPPDRRRWAIGAAVVAALGLAALVVLPRLGGPRNAPPVEPAAAPAGPIAPGSPRLDSASPPAVPPSETPRQPAAEPPAKPSPGPAAEPRETRTNPRAGAAATRVTPDTPARRGAVAPAESVKRDVAVSPPPAPPPPPPPAPVPQSRPDSVARAPAAAAAAAPSPVDDRAGVEAAITAYARALEAGDLALATRLNPGMSAAQRQGLEAFWKAGGVMTPQWKVSDITIDGDRATARIEGINRVSTRREPPSDQRVNLFARLERRGTGWHLVSLTN